MNSNRQKRIKREIRHKRVRSRVTGTAQRPRLSVFRANTHIYAQVIDDGSGKTLVSASSLEVSAKGGSQPKADQPLAGANKSGGKLTNVVFMGMGEPFLNWENVWQAIKIINDDNCFGIGARKISISTSGIIEGIEVNFPVFTYSQ